MNDNTFRFSLCVLLLITVFLFSGNPDIHDMIIRRLRP